MKIRYWDMRFEILPGRHDEEARLVSSRGSNLHHAWSHLQLCSWNWISWKPMNIGLTRWIYKIACGFWVSMSIFILLVMALVTDGIAKVHKNGLFIEEIFLGMGIRHTGCPLAPQLFALASQPLMSLLNCEEVEGQLQGIPIGELEEQLLYQLFADYTSLFLLEHLHLGDAKTTLIRLVKVVDILV